ncbi:hypothetical protein N7478_000792 [Penicillium angulare]|uniref:uncharacterized protein n=1 Tax=Penicillium angulare TaxID=116970 RepID=UPI00253FCDFD|nr:uncharacterized protein N7478_000792 [Penicillium angulare]KAJ5291541.1 hypothetical protein N7478_000792 [Penicillium angulare]
MKFSLAAGSLAWLFGLVSASQYAIFHQDGDATLASQPNHTLIFTHSVERQSWILEQFEEGINIGNAGNGLYVKCGLQSGASCEAADTPTTFDLSPQGDNSYTVNVLHGDLLWTVKNDVLYLELADGSDSQRFILSKTSGIEPVGHQELA